MTQENWVSSTTILSRCRNSWFELGGIIYLLTLAVHMISVKLFCWLEYYLGYQILLNIRDHLNFLFETGTYFYVLCPYCLAVCTVPTRAQFMPIWNWRACKLLLLLIQNNFLLDVTLNPAISLVNITGRETSPISNWHEMCLVYCAISPNQSESCPECPG